MGVQIGGGLGVQLEMGIFRYLSFQVGIYSLVY